MRLDVAGAAARIAPHVESTGAEIPLDMYQPYIDGLKEIEDINREFRARYFR